MRYGIWRFCVLMIAASALSSARAEIPEVAKLKARAEAGDPVAQYEFALHFGVGSSEWDHWLRTSAARGNGRAEDELAWALNYQNFSTYFADERMRALHLKSKGPSMRQALLWASSAADKGFPRSRLLLGMAFANGYLLPRDQAEAYKWLKLSASGGSIADIASSSTRDRLLKEMPLEAVKEGERRAALYRPGSAASAIRTQLVLPLLKVSGLATIGGKRVALIKGKKLVENEDTTMEVDGSTITIRAVSITDKEAVITLPPDQQQYRLHP